MERFLVEVQEVLVRAAPAEDSPVLTTLRYRDFLEASGVTHAHGLEWVRLPKNATVTRDGERIAIGLREEGFAQTEDPLVGVQLQRECKRVVVDEVVEEGALSKREIQRILGASHRPDMLLPLESKYWSARELELYVASEGQLRPKWCSMPDERALVCADMGEADVARALSRAAAWIANADALLIGSGAGMGVDCGLSTFRGKNAGVWPGLDAVGLAYEEICHPRWFQGDSKGAEPEPQLAWAFWNFCHRVYQATAPHSGYDVVRQWAEAVPLGAFSFTSNIDGHWMRSGLHSNCLVEVHGAVRWLQCSKPCRPDVWKAPASHDLTEDQASHRARGRLPTCPACGAVARPNVQMFGGDAAFSQARRSSQLKRYEAWLSGLESRPHKDRLRVVCVELGCGLTVPTVRKELERTLERFQGARLIRVNPESHGLAPELAARSVGVPLKAGVAIEEIAARMRSKAPETCRFVFRDPAGVFKTARAPKTATWLKVLHFIEKGGEEVTYGDPRGKLSQPPPLEVEWTKYGMPPGDPLAQAVHPVFGNHFMPLDRVAPSMFLEGTRPRPGAEPEVWGACQLWNVWFGAESSQEVVDGADWCIGLLGELSAAAPAIGPEARRQADRHAAGETRIALLRRVLPSYGLEPCVEGLNLMFYKFWLFGFYDPRIGELAAALSWLRPGDNPLEREASPREP